MKLKRSRRERESTSVVEVVQQSRLYFGPEEPTLQLECWEEELSAVQLEVYKKADQEYNNVKTKLNSIVKESGGEVVYTGEEFTAYSVPGSSQDITELVAASSAYLPPVINKTPGIGKKKGKKEKETKYVSPPTPPSPEVPVTKEIKKMRSTKEKTPKNIPVTPTSNVQTISSGLRPSEASAYGGLSTGSSNKNTIVDLTKDDSKHAPDSREVAFNKLQGKTFPSLVVVARPYLRTKEGLGNSDRGSLDSKVKSVLMHTPTKFTEWLIQQGLVRSEQICGVHPANKLKLGMYSDVSKFPYSGGYVWISECCPTRFVSVFSGSVFEGAVHPPSVLLKLIYHWACQTNVQNVVQWVKVDNLYVKGFFTWLRAACTAALHHHMNLLGGNGRKIEVGVISLGTTSHDGLQRQVKVEVLGILDTEAKLVRLRAVEPLADGERNYKKRFQKILEPLLQWVHTDSVILTDLTVDKGTLIQMGFKTVHQVSNNESSSKSNANIMEYLRRIVPRMFQNTLSLLSRQIIQQFLDELVWREWYGTSPGQAFDNIVLHLAEQTRLDAKENLVIRLNKISTNPFKNWKCANNKSSKVPVQPFPLLEIPKESKRGRKKKEIFSPPPPSPPTRRAHTTKETRKRKSVNYIEPDDDDDVILLETKKDKKLKKKDDIDVYEVKKDKKKKYKPKEEKFKIEKKEKKKEELKISIKKDIKEEQMVNLETYYFGQLEGENVNLKKQMLVQCTECHLEFNNSKELQLHIFTHISNNTDSEVENHLCRYCLASNSSMVLHNSHLTEFHPVTVKCEENNSYACLICDIAFSSLSVLSSHMQKTHVQTELPYGCGICGFRVSSHRLCVDHFYAVHDHSAALQCPYCLKTIKVFVEGHDLQSNVEFFINHLRDHQNKNLPLKCNRCSLKFVHLGALKEHQVSNHITILEAKPVLNEGFLISRPKNKATPPVKDSANHVFMDTFDNLTLVIPEGYLCKECNYQLEDERHFLGICKCTKCSYQTCCWKSLLQHSGMCQMNKIRGQETFLLPSTVYCICNYSTNDGNDLARHLAICERRSGYFSEEQAKMNTIAVSSSKQSIMDSLCLQPNRENEYTSNPAQVESINDYSAPPPVINTQLSLDDLAPPSVLQHDQMELEQLKNEAYEQPLATPQIRHDELDVSDNGLVQQPMPQTEQISQPDLTSQALDSYMDSAGEFEPLPAEPMPQPEFEPL